MHSGSLAIADAPLLRYVLGRADDALVLGHRLSEWCGHGPMLEEDLALANLALDLIGQARTLYTYAGVLEGAGRDEDAYAYLRDERGYRNLLLVEQPNGDFAATIVRQFLYAAWADPYWRQMTRSADATLAAIAAKAEKELAYHLRHTGEWMIRLGDGTAESHERAQRALDNLWWLTGECADVGPGEQALIETGIAVNPAAVQDVCRDTVSRVLRDATLVLPTGGVMRSGGRLGRHSEHLGHLLTDLQYLQRTHPGATW